MYGFGILAINGGEMFSHYSERVIESLKYGIEIQLGT